VKTCYGTQGREVKNMDLRLDSVGGVREYEEPSTTPSDHGEHYSVHYEIGERPSRTFMVVAPKRPSEDLLLSVEIAEENGAFYMRAVEVDVSVEGDNPSETLQDLSASVREWLEYLREEEPALASDLENQRRYVALLRFDSSTWFKARTVG
jgi:hypothetical protein